MTTADFERAAFDEAFVEQRLHILVVNEGAGGCDLGLVDFRCDLGGEILGEAPLGTDVGHGDAEGFAGDDGDDGAVSHFLVDRLADFPDFARGVLGGDAGLFDQLDEGAGGAVADGRLVRGHFDDGVVDAHAGEGGEHVLDGVDLDAALGEGGGTLDGLHFIRIRVDERLVREIDTAEFETVVFRSGFEGECDFFSSVEGGAFEGGGAG